MSILCEKNDSVSYFQVYGSFIRQTVLLYNPISFDEGSELGPTCFKLKMPIFSYTFCQAYQDYCKASWKLKKIEEAVSFFSTANDLLIRHLEKMPATRLGSPESRDMRETLGKDLEICMKINYLFGAYRYFYGNTIKKFTVFIRLIGSLLVGSIILASCVFYKTFRLGNYFIERRLVISTTLAVVSYILRKTIEISSDLKKENDTESWKRNIYPVIGKILGRIEGCQSDPFGQYSLDLSAVSSEDGYRWAQQKETGVWFFQKEGETTWTHGNRYWNRAPLT